MGSFFAEQQLPAVHLENSQTWAGQLLFGVKTCQSYFTPHTDVADQIGTTSPTPGSLCSMGLARMCHGSALSVVLCLDPANHCLPGCPLQIACGDTHTLVATENGELYTFGRNQNGQLGHGNTNDLLSPKRVEDLRVRQHTDSFSSSHIT